MPLITRDFIISGQSGNGGWNRAQLQMIGVSWPPPSGWIGRALGNSISAAAAERFLELRGNAGRVRARKTKVPAHRTGTHRGSGMSGWQPIETAPKNRRRVLAVTWPGTIEVMLFDSRDGWMTIPGKWKRSPTHWMALPELPTEPERTEDAAA